MENEISVGYDLNNEEDVSRLTSELLAYLIKNPIDYTKFPSIDKILLNEDYILYFYLVNGIKNGLTLTRETLELALNQNVHHWMNKRSILYKKTKSNMDKDYIQNKVSTNLVAEADYKEAFIAIVLNRFDYLSNLDLKIDFDSEYLMDLIRKMVESELGVELIEEVIDLMKKDKYYKGELYSSTTVLPYLRNRITDMDVQLSSTAKFDDYSSYIQNEFMKDTIRYNRCFKWNLGKNIHLPSVDLGHMVSLLGQEKVGKTKFSLGEMAYPTIVSGENVLLLSSEMSEVQLISILASKHIYNMEGFKVSVSQVESCIGTQQAFDTFGITLEDYEKQKKEYLDVMSGKKEIDNYKNYVDEEDFKILYKMRDKIDEYARLSEAKREVITIYFNDIITNKKLGRSWVLTNEDNIFNIDNMVPTIHSLAKKYNASLVIYDHAGYAYSQTNLSKTEVMTKVYQNAKVIARKKDHPVAFVVINHIETSSSEKLKSSGEKDNTVIRAFNTSEAKKSADIELVLYTTEELQREGAVNLKVLVSREEEASKEPITMVVDYMVNDFTALGSSKDKYK